MILTRGIGAGGPLVTAGLGLGSFGLAAEIHTDYRGRGGRRLLPLPDFSADDLARLDAAHQAMRERADAGARRPDARRAAVLDVDAVIAARGGAAKTMPGAGESAGDGVQDSAMLLLAAAILADDDF